MERAQGMVWGRGLCVGVFGVAIVWRVVAWCARLCPRSSQERVGYGGVQGERQVGFVAVRGPRQPILAVAQVLFTSSTIGSIHASVMRFVSLP